MKDGYSVLLGFKLVVAVAIVTLGLTVLATEANADLVIGAQSVSANAGSTGNSFEVYLTNTGSSSVDVAAFSFEISTTSSNINLTGATTSTTDAYIFGADSLFGPEIDTSTGQTLDASDVFATPSGSTSIGSGSTFGLGEISFDVGPGASPGNYTVSFTPYPSTSLSDPNGNDLTFSSADGTLTVNGAPNRTGAATMAG